MALLRRDDVFSSHLTPFIAEVWSLYALGVVMTITRLASRLRVMGVRNLQADDSLAVLAIVRLPILDIRARAVVSHNLLDRFSTLRRRSSHIRAELPTFLPKMQSHWTPISLKACPRKIPSISCGESEWCIQFFSLKGAVYGVNTDICGWL